MGELAVALKAYWSGKCAGRPMPARRDLDPVDIPKLLPNILLLDVEADTDRIRMRLAGTRITDLYGRDYTGQYLDEIYFGRNRERVMEAYESVVRSGKEHHCWMGFTNQDGLEFDMERLILPLSSDGSRIDMLIALLDIHLHQDV